MNVFQAIINVGDEKLITFDSFAAYFRGGILYTDEKSTWKKVHLHLLLLLRLLLLT